MTDSPPFECGPECPAPEHDQAADVPAYPYMADELWHSMAANEHGVDWDPGDEPARLSDAEAAAWARDMAEPPPPEPAGLAEAVEAARQREADQETAEYIAFHFGDPEVEAHIAEMDEATAEQEIEL